jgi:hypothetical protein
LSVHDPKNIIENIRNHLATHDRPIAFLFGAGTSSAVNIAPVVKSGEKRLYKPLVPSIEPLTERCKAAVVNLGKAFSNAWELLERECAKVNVEHILSRIHSKIDAIGAQEKLLGLSMTELQRMEDAIRKTIAGAVILKEDMIPERLPHDNFTLWIRRSGRTIPLEIFTTNYDILFERALERAHIPFFDGFVGGYEPFFFGESLGNEELLPGNKWIRLWKIHGSVNWQLVKHSGKEKIIRTQVTPTGEMIFPSHRKYDQSRKQPYTALMDRLGQVISKAHSLLICCGYGFGDEHINAVLFSVLDNYRTTNVITLQFGELSQENQVVKWATERTNFTVIGANGGVIGGRWGTWQLLNPVDEQTHSFMDIAFDSDASKPDSSQASIEEGRSGKMRIVDFNGFCDFLSTMGREGGKEL